MVTNLRKFRRRKTLSRRRTGGRGRGTSRLHINWGPVLLFGGIGVGVIALVLVIIFVIVPLFGDGGSETVTSTPSATITPSATPMANDSMSELAKELTVEYKSVNDPYIYGSEMIFASCSKLESDSFPDRLVLYDMVAGTTVEVAGIERKNNCLLEPKINESYMVYLDCKSEYGGSVCGVNRETGEVFVMRDYLYGMPKVSLSGQYAVWMQQTGKGTDRLYVYDMATKEVMELETFINVYFSYSAAYVGEDAIVYVQPEGESTMTTQNNSSASTNAEIIVVPLVEGGDTKAVHYLPGMFAYNPLITGDYIVFLNGTGNAESELMVSEKSGTTYSAPVSIAKGVLNYDIGDGYVVYTLDDVVHIYYLADGSTGRLSSEATRAMLGSANGKDVVWYDITGGLESTPSAIMHITVP